MILRPDKKDPTTTLFITPKMPKGIFRILLFITKYVIDRIMLPIKTSKPNVRSLFGGILVGITHEALARFGQTARDSKPTLVKNLNRI